MTYARRASVAALVSAVVACGGSTETGPEPASGGSGGMGGMASGGAPATGGGPVGTGGAAEATLPPQSCEAGSYAVDLDEEGMLACAPFEADVPAAVDEHCALHFGWRDNCSGCADGPAKVGRVNGSACDNLAGADNTCTSPMLGGITAPLFGLNTDGDVDGNDMFHAGWHCPPQGETGLTGPCEADEHAVWATVDGQIECMPAERIVTAYVRAHCTLYFGWRDNCNGCPDPPSKWGSQRGPDCTIGAGTDNHCGASLVGGQWVPMVGINTDGDVDDNDTFFMGLFCEEPSSASVAADERCPFGTLLTGVDDDGALLCSSPVDVIAPAVRQGCQLTLGYRDDCNGCVDPPEKWGRTSTVSCDPALGSTCGTHSLDGVPVPLVGIRSDGDVDGNDKFYVALTCQ